MYTARKTQQKPPKKPVHPVRLLDDGVLGRHPMERFLAASAGDVLPTAPRSIGAIGLLSMGKMGIGIEDTCRYNKAIIVKFKTDPGLFPFNPHQKQTFPAQL